MPKKDTSGMSSLSPESRSQLLSQLRADLSERWHRGERVPVEYYLAQNPDLAADAEGLVALIQSEIAHRLESGERPSLEEYVRRFPQHADALRRSWPQLQITLTQAREDSALPASTINETPCVTPFPLPPAPALCLPGLELHEKLGEGGMGVVYRARDVRLDRPRAVKVIRRGPFGDGEARDRFNREAKAVARLDHAGVVRIYALGEHEGVLFICMEYLEGGSLQELLRRGPPEVRAAADLVRQLALAVQHAHENRVLHRDLKPGNVLLTAGGAPKVTDFGLAKLLDIDDDLTQTGAVLGTPSYMAPEQAEGRSGQVRECTDIWALGAILYECLTGRPPFRGETRSETVEQITKRAPVPPRRLRAEVPPELEAVCLKCLRKEPGRRYATAAALAADLQDWLDGKPTRLRPAPGWRRLARGVRRHWLAASLAVVLAAGLGAGAFLLRGTGQPEPAPAGQPPAPGVWHPLLTREPTPLLWPGWDENKDMRYDPGERKLRVSCRGLALFPLGHTAAPHYRLAVTLQQNLWVGNIGLFFGYRDEPAGGKQIQSYQVLELSSEKTDDPGWLLRVNWKAVSHNNPANPELRVVRNIVTSDPFRLSPAEHRLGLAVGPGGLEAVTLDDKVLPGLSAADAGARNARPPGPADYPGTFGVCVDMGNGTFRDARYLFREEP
jgi:hypothetical protein